jgi:EAL domain-containing protein (putative c-di-GMP-specific phosphodiesterase class I)
VSGLTYFASETGCELIAEGIETQAELDALRDLGIQLGQGYLLGRPKLPG